MGFLFAQKRNTNIVPIVIEENNPVANVFREYVRPERGKANAKLLQLHGSKCPPPRWVRAQRARLRTHLPRDRGVVWGGGQESDDV